jgi:hypothetical protein
MNIEKAQWSTQGLNVRVQLPISKIDEERRVVSGFATLDNIDKQDDIVETAASISAFKRFKGNIREMHQPLAVGKVVAFKEDRYFDPETKKFYNGIFVSAYVSKGAQDTWEKVLDGTLAGFSIGGNITKTEDVFNKEVNRSIRIIKEYDLFELSLVDNPANQFANVISIQKVDGENVIGGYLSKATVDNVFYCANDQITKISPDAQESCPTCTDIMSNIGFVEKMADEEEDTTMIKFLVDSAKGISAIKMNKEVSPMTENTEVVATDTDVVADAVVEKSEVAPEATVGSETDIVEKAEKPMPMMDEKEPAADDADEKPADEDAEDKDKAKAKVSKSDEDLASAISDINASLTSAFSDLNATIKSLSDEVATLKKAYDGVTTTVTDITKSFNEIGKRVDSAVSATAFRKSGDLGEIVQLEPVKKAEKSLWGGRFLKNTDLFNQ